MIDKNNTYSRMQKSEYDANAHLMVIENHARHNKNPDYWDILLGAIKSDPKKWSDKIALDFGCGAGRNVLNLLSLAPWKRVDGVDISSENVANCRKFMEKSYPDKSKYDFAVNDGVSLSCFDSNTYDFVMSTIVFQHICVYDIRFSLLQEIFRVLKPSGLFSFQMGFGPGNRRAVDYFENDYDASGTNGKKDVRVNNKDQIYNDLTKIGFKNLSHKISKSWLDAHDKWIFIEAYKPAEA
ncbi:MAG: class I SAM-dependent methyltransferase [bacterium]|nr:class I SAM-dependent methyltransferase [bacterium]